MRFFEAFVSFFGKVLLSFGENTPTLSGIEAVGFYLTAVIGTLFTLCYAYQFFYLFLACIVTPKKYKSAPMDKRYAVVIAARNEARVLPHLLESIKGQTYPRELIDIFVVADNCTDETAAVARRAGATVFERHNQQQVGKGYALAFLFDRIRETRGLDAFDGYLFFDADNVLRPDFMEQMGRAHAAGHRVITSYRNSKNYGKTWISAGYSLWFLRESRHLQNPRAWLSCSAAISGTGFLVDRAIIERGGGWKHFLLTEDIEFTADCILHGDRVGYCHAAELFDEQPETFAQSWRQRKRWSKGMFQVIRHYGKGLLKGALRLRWSSFDMLMNITPAFVLSSVQLIATVVLFLLNWVVNGAVSLVLLQCLADFFIFGYGIFFVLGLFALVSEWRRIYCRKPRAVLLLFTFPIFMLTYIPISLAAFFSRRVEWKPVEHKHALTAAEIESAGTGRKNKMN